MRANIRRGQHRAEADGHAAPQTAPTAAAADADADATASTASGRASSTLGMDPSLPGGAGRVSE